MAAGKSIPGTTLEALVSLERLAKLQGMRAAWKNGRFTVRFQGLRDDATGDTFEAEVGGTLILPVIDAALADQLLVLRELGVNLP